MNDQPDLSFRLPTTSGLRVARFSSSGLTAGTRVMTLHGEICVEDLKVGDKVLTKDYGAQSVKEISFVEADLLRQPELRPVMVPGNSFGAQSPSIAVFLSPDQRLALRHPLFQTFFGAGEVLARAQDLVGLGSISVVENLKALTYVQLGFARHQMVYCGNLAIDLAQLAVIPSRPVLTKQDVRIALGVISQRVAFPHARQAALH